MIILGAKIKLLEEIERLLINHFECDGDIDVSKTRQHVEEIDGSPWQMSFLCFWWLF